MKKPRKSRIPFAVSLVAVLSVVWALGGAAAQEDTSQYPALTVTLTDEGIEVEERVEAGLYRLEVDDQTTAAAEAEQAEAAPEDSEAEVSIDRLNEGVTADRARELYMGVDRAFMGEGNPGEAISELASNVTAVGGSSMPQNTVFELRPGEHLVTVISAEMRTTTFTVVGTLQAEEPEVDLTVDMLEFAFSIPEQLPAGTQTWEIQNVGDQVHHMILLRIHEGKTVDDVMAFLETEEGEPPADDVGYIPILSPGVSNYASFDLEPGEYFVICFLPDYETGQPHFMLGMMDTFTVAGE